MVKRSRSFENKNLLKENTFQRYVYEQLSYSNVDLLRELFPTGYLDNGKNIKVIIPEFPLQENHINHITDFKVILSDGSSFNIEVEWSVSKFKSHGKEVYNQYYANGKGFIITLDNDISLDYINPDSVSVIDPEKLSYWFLHRAKHIVDSTISNHVTDYNSRTKKYWVVYLSKSGGSYKDFIEKGKKHKKWAFRYPSVSKKYLMKNIFEIMSGDIVIFITGKYILNRKFVHGKSFFTSGKIVEVKNGYYCDFDDETFEKEEWKRLKDTLPKARYVSKKEYMHYFDFKYPFKREEFGLSEDEVRIPSYCKEEYTKMNRLGLLKEWNGFIDGVMESLNGSGGPVEVSVDQFNAFLSQYRLSESE
ncbi:hypothetical protein J0K78_10585 [Halobacillus sp. GSS1]|uniref:hypothetical protein n=1 Tax=Halobacillus sp. GSS1 TaxID=2815919 RepID=UPI001A8D1FC8|nr:hypothetical protein [Halobacillus sp. GSS1]MBN9654710.1 hypothetical protein [Halobacillus sp. GSS1]